jgi:hypothetical protein
MVSLRPVRSSPANTNPQSHTVDIPDGIKKSLRTFRFAHRKQGNAALVIKINKSKLVMEEDDLQDEVQLDNVSIDDLAEGTCNYANEIAGWLS